MPSSDALYRHWKRTCWVTDMWGQASEQNMVLQTLTDYGWKVEGEVLLCDWDSDENMVAVRQRVQSLLTGCR